MAEAIAGDKSYACEARSQGRIPIEAGMIPR